MWDHLKIISGNIVGSSVAGLGSQRVNGYRFNSVMIQKSELSRLGKLSN
jgi:hypothetical protein